jgi:hypothetical protein
MRRYYILIFVLGLTMGVVFVFSQARANPSKGEISGGEVTASVVYDETWQAISALVSSATGFVAYDPTGSTRTGVAAKFSSSGASATVEIAPKMLVTKWRVHGHIHFR